MELNSNYLTVRDAKKFLDMNGVEWTEVWIRLQIGAKKIKSRKIFGSRVIPREELSRIVSRKRAEAARK